MEGAPTGHPPSEERVLVLDFGAQYSQLIARRVRECRVYCEIFPGDTPASDLLAASPRGIILSGGPASVYDRDAPRCDPALLQAGIPVLGICYGHQLLAHLLGGTVQQAGRREYGQAMLHITVPDPLFLGVGDRAVVWMSHGDVVTRLPEGFHVLASSADSPAAAIGDHSRRLYGVQFHPEVTHTPQGRDILCNFLQRVCGCQGTWTMEHFLGIAVQQIREQVGGRRVLCALSGGVDSAVTAVLVHRAIGDQLTCLFVDHGLLREGEAAQVNATFTDLVPLPLVVVDATDRFLERLRGVTDPEEKRRRVGEEFVRVFEESASERGCFDLLAQGTLYPDVIESGTHSAQTIKTHHNVGGLPEQMAFELIEPLRYLFKDEVRRLGIELGLPEQLVWRQPFPGPGLAVRIVGEVTPERLAVVRRADAIVVEEITRAGLYREVAQCFAVLLSLRSVGVMGDQRTYAYPVVVRAVTSDDFMTADWARLPNELLERIARRIVNEVQGVNRVVYDITSKPPGTVEWE